MNKKAYTFLANTGNGGWIKYSVDEDNAQWIIAQIKRNSNSSEDYITFMDIDNSVVMINVSKVTSVRVDSPK